MEHRAIGTMNRQWGAGAGSHRWNPGERCFVYDEDGELILELKRPADLAHAQAVEEFLNDNVDEIKSDPDSLPPTGFRV